jgi:hypothetical protein
MCHEQGACVDFCVTSIHAKRRRRERERGRERERSERGEAERKKAGAGATWSPAVASRRTLTLLQTYKQAERQRERGAGRPAGHTLGVLPKFKFLASLLLLLPSFTACWRRSAGLTWLPDAFRLAVKLRTWVIVFRDSFLEVIIGIV